MRNNGSSVEESRKIKGNTRERNTKEKEKKWRNKRKEDKEVDEAN